MFWRLPAMFCAVVFVALSGCNGGGGATPEATVRTFFDAMKKGDAGKKEWMSCFTEKVCAFFENMDKKMGGMKQPEGMGNLSRYEIKGTTMEGDTARVAVTMTELRNGKEVTEDGWLGLKKQGGAWKIFMRGKAGEEAVNMEEQAAKADAMFKMMEEGMKGMKGFEPDAKEGQEEAVEVKGTPPPPVMTPEMEKQIKEAMEKAKAELEKAKTDATIPKEAQDQMQKLLEGFKK